MSELWLTLFGKPSAQRRGSATAVDQVAVRDAILKLNHAIDELSKRMEYDDRKALEHRRRAVEYLRAGDRRRALAAVRDKKRFERDCDKHAARAGTLTELKLALESCALDSVVVDAIHSANAALHRASKLAPIADVERLMESLEDQMQHAHDVSGEIARPLSAGAVPLDDDDLERELDDLIAADPDLAAASGAASVSYTPRLPAGAHTPAGAATGAVSVHAAAARAASQAPAPARAPAEHSVPALTVAAAVPVPGHRRTRSLSDGHLPDAPSHTVLAVAEQQQRRPAVRMDYA